MFSRSAFTAESISKRGESTKIKSDNLTTLYYFILFQIFTKKKDKLLGIIVLYLIVYSNLKNYCQNIFFFQLYS